MNDLAPQINLLAKRKKVYDRRSVLALKVKVWAGTILVIYALIMVVVLSINVFLSQKEKSAEEALNRAKMTLSANAVTILQEEKVVSRAKTIESLFNSRRESIQLWQNLRQILPQGTELTGFSLEGNILTLGITSPNVLISNRVIDMVENDIQILGATKTTADITRQNDGTYKVNLDIILKEKDEQSKT